MGTGEPHNQMFNKLLFFYWLCMQRFHNMQVFLNPIKLIPLKINESTVPKDVLSGNCISKLNKTKCVQIKQNIIFFKIQPIILFFTLYQLYICLPDYFFNVTINIIATTAIITNTITRQIHFFLLALLWKKQVLQLTCKNKQTEISKQFYQTRK